MLDNITTYIPNNYELSKLIQNKFNVGSDWNIERFTKIIGIVYPEVKGL